MKTNTRDVQALNRAEQMMRDMAAAAWFIIDDTENFEFASTGTPASGEVYNGLIRLCNDEISLLISGAILGQDTQFGTRGKEQVSQDLLQDLVSADQTLVEQYMNDKVLPALYKIGLLPVEALRFEYDKSEDVSELWQRTKEILPYKEVDSEWIKTKFGIEVKDKKVTPTTNNLSAWVTDPFFRLSPEYIRANIKMPAVAHHYFEALHKNLEEQYKPCDCPACQSLQVELAQKEDENPLFKKILKTAEKAFKNYLIKAVTNPKTSLR